MRDYRITFNISGEMGSPANAMAAALQLYKAQLADPDHFTNVPHSWDITVEDITPPSTPVKVRLGMRLQPVTNDGALNGSEHVVCANGEGHYVLINPQTGYPQGFAWDTVEELLAALCSKKWVVVNVRNLNHGKATWTGQQNLSDNTNRKD